MPKKRVALSSSSPRQSTHAATKKRKIPKTRRLTNLGINNKGSLYADSEMLHVPGLSFFRKGRFRVVTGVVFALIVGIAGTVLFTRSRALVTDKYLFNDATPALVASSNTGAAELGVKFRSSKAGYVRGIRFYKSTSNTGPHTGSLWSEDGARLGTGTFTNESASGWQQLIFSIPVRIKADTIYVASYHTDVGYYSINKNFFASDYVKPPLTAPSTTSVDGNGVYAYGASAFPTRTTAASNYWVEPIFNAYVATPAP